MNLNVALAAAAAALMSASAAAPMPALAKSPLEPAAAPKRQCFWNHRVENFATNDDKILNVRVGAKDVYQFEMFANCHEIDWAQRIALVTRGGGSTICTGMDVDVVTPTSIGPQRCLVRAVRKLTPEEVKALPKNARP